MEEKESMNCIFINRPIKECSVCMDAMKLQCFLNKPYRKVTEESKKELTKLLKENLNSVARVD
jgi:hypothetical protein